MKTSSTITLVILCACFVFSGCLKTRAQLRGESSEDREYSRPVPAGEPQPVQPQGQYVIEELKNELTQINGRVEDLEHAQKEAEEHGGGAGKEDFKVLLDRVKALE